jgi:hypothetical protein
MFARLARVFCVYFDLLFAYYILLLLVYTASTGDSLKLVLMNEYVDW